MTSIGIAVATFGGEEWAELARARALPSVHRQTTPADQVVHVHGPTLHEARNRAAAELETDFIIFLDADDELDERYVEAMLVGTGDLRQPATIGVYPDGREDDCAILIEQRPLLSGNFLVIGTMMRRDQFLAVGGFGTDLIYEDWDLFLRLVIAGATVGATSDAIYRVHVNNAGRNSQSRDLQLSMYAQIRQRYVHAAGKAWL